MKIGYLISNYLPRIGGAEAFIHNMATELTRRGHAAIVATPSRGSEIDHLFKYKVERLNPLLTRLLFINFDLGKLYTEKILCDLQKKHKPDIWQATIGYPLGAAAVDFFNRSRIPCVLRCVGEDIQIYPELKYGYRLKKKSDAVMRNQYKKFTHVIAASEAMKSDFISLGVPDSKIKIIPNGVDCMRFEKETGREDTRKALGIKDEQKLLLTVGRNHPKKGFDQIIPIARILSEKGADFKWLLIGKRCDEIIREAEKEGLSGYFISAEVKAEIAPDGGIEIPSRKLVRYYKAADIFIFPTYIELFAKVLIEAMAAGLAIVTTSAPGADEMIEHGVNGLKSAPKDAEGMAALVLSVLSDKELEKRLKDNALSVSKKYNWDTVANSYTQLYESLIN